jgi:hypothetical protein
MAVISNGTTLIDAGSLGASAGAGKLTLIKTLTASGSSTLSFVHGASSVVFDSTYDSYIFEFINIHPSGTNRFQFNGSVDAGSNYNVSKTTGVYICGVREDGADNAFIYQGSDDLHNSTSFQDLMAYGDQDADNDHSLNGTVQIFAPSSTTFVKHFIASSQGNINTNYTVQTYVSGYFNNTSDVDAIRFQMHSGTFDGVIKLYGVG